MGRLSISAFFLLSAGVGSWRLGGGRGGGGACGLIGRMRGRGLRREVRGGEVLGGGSGDTLVVLFEGMDTCLECEGWFIRL